MTTVVVSQPMLFPWVGMLEQIRLADIFVHYDDVQYSKGGFGNRVQVKTAAGPKWMTVPLREVRLGQRISEVEVVDDRDWRSSHLSLLDQSYRGAPHHADMLALVQRVHAHGDRMLADYSIRGLEALCEHFDLLAGRRFVRSSELGIGGASSRRVLDVVKMVGGDVYVTGHGAQNYLDHELFERESVEVRYVDYLKVPYGQLHGAFTPFVTSLDLVANAGRDGSRVIRSPSVHWKEFLAWKK